jgi:UDP-N-acetylglucosamine 4,6-dehydratase
MKVTDVAAALGPDLGQKIVGIRPGEKLHEVMITKDDARMTLELPSHYIIQPAFSFWRGAAASFPSACSVPEDFEYTSSNNKQWLDAPALRELLRAELDASAIEAGEARSR